MTDSSWSRSRASLFSGSFLDWFQIFSHVKWSMGEQRSSKVGLIWISRLEDKQRLMVLSSYSLAMRVHPLSFLLMLRRLVTHCLKEGSALSDQRFMMIRMLFLVVVSFSCHITSSGDSNLVEDHDSFNRTVLGRFR